MAFGALVGIRDLFRKPAQDEVFGTKVLVAFLDAKFAELAGADRDCYAEFYSKSTQILFEDVSRLLGEINGYDVVHLLCDVMADGHIADTGGHKTSGTELIRRCVDCNVKLLWIASENQPQGYIKGFKLAGQRVNLVLTMDRRASRFKDFLQSLLRRISRGETMPIAWVALCPQNPNDPRTENAPACIFAAGRGGVRLRR